MVVCASQMVSKVLAITAMSMLSIKIDEMILKTATRIQSDPECSPYSRAHVSGASSSSTFSKSSVYATSQRPPKALSPSLMMRTSSHASSSL